MGPPPYFGAPMPPQFMYPPPPPPPPGRSGKSFARTIFTALASIIFVGSLVLNGYLILFSGILNVAGGQHENTIDKGDLTSRIVVLPVSGIIDEKMFEKVDKHLKELSTDKRLKALIVEVNSPGGSVTASDEIYQSILAFKAKAGKPVVIYQRGLAASGGYYISCAGDHIVAQRTTMTGNIGVLLPRYNLSAMLDKWGVKDTTIRSEKSPFKNIPSMTQPDTAEGDAYLKAIIDDAYDQFAAVVKSGRQPALAKAGKGVKDVANGKIYLADEALTNGLVDTVGELSAAIAEATRRAGLGATKPSVIRIEDQPSLLDLLGGQSRSGLTPPVGQGGGIEINAFKLDAGNIRELMVPKLMYLWDGN
jgi:protease-4